MKKNLYLLPLLLLLTGCAVLQPATELPPQATGASPPAPPAATQEPAEPPSATAAPTIPPAETGQVSGRVCYPSEFIPAMTAYFLETGSQVYTELAIAENQDAYSIDLPPGTYQVFAWRDEYQLGGAYTAYVACGYDESCTDHGLLDVAVEPGASVTGIDICDWVLVDLPLPETEDEMPADGTDPLAGLVYRTADGLWMIEPSGVHRVLTDNPDAMVLSSEGLAYTEDDDIWLLDAVSGQATNLTNTAGRIETLWTGDSNPPGALLFSSFPVDFELGPGVTGFLTLVNLDGTGYEVLDDENQVWHFDVAPDGVRVAYGLGPVGWIHDLATGERSAFEASEYGLDGVTSMGSPAWSPDGSKISWVIGIQPGAGQPFSFGLAVFDLVARTGLLLHPHEIPGMDGYPPAAAWRPGGEWLAYTVFDADFERGGIWLLKADGTAEFRLGQGGNPVWSLDGGALVYLDSSNGQLLHYDAIALKTTPLDFSNKNALPVTWLP